jgi:replicative DNA helicase
MTLTLPVPEPPTVPEAEECVLGSAMTDPAACRWTVLHLEADDFYRPAHRTIFEVIASLTADGLAVSAPAVATILRNDNLLADVGGHPFLVSLVEAVDTVSAVAQHGRKVREAARLRRLTDAGIQIAGLGGEPSTTAERAEATAFQIVQALDRPEAREAANPEAVVAAMTDTETAGRVVSWGLPALDAQTGGGLHAGHLTVLASRPGVGKSSLGLQAAALVAEALPVVVASYEMNRKEIGQHHLALLGDVTMDQALRWITGPRMAGPIEAYKQLKLTVLDGLPDLDRLMSHLYALHAVEPLALVVVDYLQLVPISLPKGSNRQEHVAAISRALKLVAARLGFPVLCLSQLNRDATDRRPRLSDLRESGAIEQDADDVIFLYADPDRPDEREAIVAKQRMGPLGSVVLGWDGPRAMFTDPGDDPRGRQVAMLE